MAQSPIEGGSGEKAFLKLISGCGVLCAADRDLSECSGLQRHLSVHKCYKYNLRAMIK